MVSKKCPSDVDASPIVPKATSLPVLLKFVVELSSLFFLKYLDARASPNKRGIWLAVGDESAEELY